MTSVEIMASIQDWEFARQDSEKLITYFDKGNCCSYYFPEYASTSEYLHAYPGIYNDEIYFFIIPSAYDKDEYHDTIDLYTTPCLLINTVGDSDDRISSAEAERRIKAWKDNYTTWIPEQVNSEYGIFEAFSIPSQDCEVQNVIITMALKVQASAISGYEADLVVTNEMGKQIIYDDFVNPVPPFSAAPSSEDEFSLLPANT